MGPRNRQRRDQRRAKAQASMAGEGMYIYQNITNSDIYLPRPTHAGRRMVGPREKFIGDSYYKNIKELMCLQEVIAPMQEQKLLTEVPPVVTNHGQVEYVVQQPGKPLNEANPLSEEEEKKDKLLVEQPLEGVRILR